MRFTALCSLVATVSLILGSSSAKAAFINTTDRGWYMSGTYYHDPFNINYLTGTSGNEYRSFFVFDLSGISDPIVSASFKVYTYEVSGAGTFSLFDFGSSISTLTNGTGGSTAFNDLGSGNVLGTYNYTGSEGNQFVNVNLNSNGLAYLNANLGQTVAIGGHFNSSTAYVYGFSGGAPSNTQLVYQVGTSANPVPAPAGLLLGLIGTATLGLFHRVRRTFSAKETVAA